MRNLAACLAAVLGPVLAAGVTAAHAQGEHEDHQPAATPEISEPSPPPMHQMPMTGPLGSSMTREASGTAWLPDETEMRMHHGRLGPFDLMAHYHLYGGYDYQAGDQGASDPISTNWFMGMAQTKVAGGDLKLRAMLSLEPLTVGKDGYPLLLQTGETYQGMPLVDRQHPHDLFMETAAMYTLPVGSEVALQVYGGPVGEPALGPAAFPHRQSAWSDPLAPLGHHWLDSTHISFGVVTAGILTRWAKIEGSWFNGREPDEERYDFDLRGFDSYAARVSVNPSPRWSLQASYGYLASPETLHPEESVQRYTTSATHTMSWGHGRSWASTAALGINQPSEGDLTYAALVETSLDLHRLGVSFARLEQLAKGPEDFGMAGHATLNITSAVLGHLHAFPALASVEPALGVRVSANLIDDQLRTRYGTRIPFGGMVYLRLAPAKHMM